MSFQPKTRGSLSRRDFLKGTGATLGVLAAPSILHAQSAEIELRAMVFNVAWGEAVADTISDAYLEHTNGRVKIVGDLTPYENLYEKLVLELSVGSDTYDIISSDVFWIKQLIANNWVTSLDEMKAADPSLPDIQWDNLNSSPYVYSVVDGKHVGMPVSLATPVYVYRKDLMEAAGLEVPRDWDAFAKVCAALHSSDRAGYMMLLGGQDACVTEWAVRLSSLGDVEWGSDGVLGPDKMPIFNNEGRGVEALNRIIEVLPYTPQGVLNLDYPDAVTLMAGDKSAQLITWNEAVPGIEDGALAGKFGYTTYPSGASKSHVVGGFHMLMNKSSSHPREVYDFFAWMSEGKAYELMADKGEAALVLKSQLADPNTVKRIPMTAVWNDFNSMGYKAMALTPYSVTNADEVQRILFEEIVEGASGGKTPEKAMADAEARIISAVS